MALTVFEGRHGLLAHYEEDQVIGRSLCRYGEWAEEEIYLLSKFVRPGDVVLDIGANVGSHTIAFGRMVGDEGRVLAVDGQRRASEVLTLNILLNGQNNITRIEGLVGCGDAVVRLATGAKTPANNLGCVSFHDIIARSNAASAARTLGLPVPLFTVDSLELSACRLMKIDVEGMELDVISGAAETITQHKPVIYFEQANGSNFAKIYNFLNNAEYKLFWHVANPYNRNNFCNDPENIFGGTCEVNVLGIHHSQTFSPPAGIDLPQVVGENYVPPPSVTGQHGWSLPLGAYNELPAVQYSAAIAMPQPAGLVLRNAHDLLQARFLDLEQDRMRAQEIMNYQADLIAQLRRGEAA